jgi:hypothetical protein
MSDLVLRLAADATVRGATTTEGIQVFSVYDSIALFCGKSESYARTTWTRLISEKSTYKSELEGLVYTATFCSSINNRPFDTPCMTLRGLQRLVMILGGKVAADFRQIVEGVFTRYNAGDLSMIQEIQEHAVSDAPIHQAYRQALAQEPVVDSVGAKRQLDREQALLELEIQERKQALEEKKARMPVELQQKSMQNVQMFAGLMTSLNPDWTSDARLRLQLEDSMKNAFFTPTQPLLTNGEAQVSLTRSIDVSTVAQDLGVRLKDGDRLAIGKLWKKRYFATYGEVPPLHDQFVNGAVRKVCSYTERDRPMGESVIREYVCNKPR